MLTTNHTLKFFFALLFLGLFSSACQKENGLEPTVVQDGNVNNDDTSAPADYNVLFVGNSLTYYNSLPLLVEVEAEQRGINVSTDELAFANFALIDHWEAGTLQNLIESSNYDFVVGQQGPSSQAYGRMILIEYGGLIKDLCDEHNTQLAFYMVWPSVSYYHTFPGVIQNYTDAATFNNAILCPVVSLWKDYQDATGDFSFYGPDNFHPTQAGSQFAAEIIVDTLFD